MTGTHDRSELSFGAQRMAQQSGCESVRSGATRSDNSTTATAEAKTPKPALVADLGAIVPFVAMKCETSGGGTRTHDTRIMIPLL